MDERICEHCQQPKTQVLLKVMTFGDSENIPIPTDTWECHPCDVKALRETVRELREQLHDARQLAEAYKSACEYLQAGDSSGSGAIAPSESEIVVQHFDDHEQLMDYLQGIEEGA